MVTADPSNYPNLEAIRRCLDLYLDAMRPFVVRYLRRKRGWSLEEAIYRCLNDEHRAANFKNSLAQHNNQVEAAIDFGILRSILTDKQNWEELFHEPFKGSHTIRSGVHFITEVRNQEAHRGMDDVDETKTLTLMGHVIEILHYVNRPDALLLVQQEQDRLFTRLMAALNEEREATAGYKERQIEEREAALATTMAQAEAREAGFVAAIRQAEAREASLNDLDEAVASLEKVAVERAIAVTDHEVAIAEHEAAVAEHEAAIADLEAAITLYDAARNDAELDLAREAIRRAEAREAAANERETASNEAESAANLREEAANRYQASADDYEIALKQHGAAVAEAVARATEHGEAAAAAIRRAEEREIAAREALRRAGERETAADHREDTADQREAEVDERKAAADRHQATVPAPRPAPDNLPERWGEVITTLVQVKGQKHPLGALLRECGVSDVRFSDDGSKLVLPFRSAVIGRMLIEEMSHPEVRDRVESAIEQAFDQRYQIEVVRP